MCMSKHLQTLLLLSESSSVWGSSRTSHRRVDYGLAALSQGAICSSIRRSAGGREGFEGSYNRALDPIPTRRLTLTNAVIPGAAAATTMSGWWR